MAVLDRSARNQASMRLDWVDALRGVAVIAVVTVHTAYCFPAIGRNFIKLASAGRYGVDLFFVISGFVLYHTYRRLAADSAKPRRIFLFRRWARLAPVYYMGILGYSYILLWLSSARAANIGETSLNILFLNGWIPARANAVVPGGWSISAEAAYALFFVAVLPLLSSSRRAFWACLSAGFITRQTSLLLRTMIGSFFGSWAVAKDFGYVPWLHLPTFMAGVWCWHAWNRRQSSNSPLSPKLRSLCMIIASAMLLTLSWGIWPGTDQPLIAGAGSALAFYAWSAGQLPQGLVSPLAYVGRLSYGIYVIHFCVVELAQQSVVELMPAATPSFILFAGTFLTTIVISIPIAWLSWSYFERPVQILASNYTEP